MRTDLPIADQMVQVGHACLDAGRRFAQPEAPCHLVVMGVGDQQALLAAVEGASPVRFALFWEPDDALGWTAACSEPVYGTERRRFRRYSLWRYESER